MGTARGGVEEVFRAVARWRHARALHPQGRRYRGVLQVAGSPSAGWPAGEGAWPLRARWSRALGLPGGWPDGYGLALRVVAAGGPGTTLDLLLTSSGSGMLSRHLPLLRADPRRGVYSTLTSYRLPSGTRVLLAVPVAGGPTDTWRGRRLPLTLGLYAAGRTCAPQVLGTIRLTEQADDDDCSFDPYRHQLPQIHPTRRLAHLRARAYAGSREGRDADR